jgi:hypothetical protein
MQKSSTPFRIVYGGWFTAILIMSVFIIAGCSSNSGSSSGSGTLGISLTDAPACGYDEVNVTVSKVRVHQSASATENDAGWIDITLTPARKINLLDLTNGASEELGQTPLTAGHYSQLRLVPASNGTGTLANSLVLSGVTPTTEIPLDTPSAVQSGLKLINEFDVLPGQRIDLVLDFDACKSVVKRGQSGRYNLKPVIRVIPFVLNGINGFVATSLTGSNVAVSAQLNGAVVRSTVPDPQTGEFFLARLDAPNNYDVVITADGHATAVIAGVPISSSTSTATVSSNFEPITLPTSTTRTISGTVVLAPPNTDVTASVATKQTVTGGTTVAVKSQNVDADTGAYSFTLPADAPLLASYGTGSLPLAFTPQPDVAGKYKVEASATGYVTQPVDVDISATDVTQNFTLVP